MAGKMETSADRKVLESLENLGAGTAFADQIFSLVGNSQFFAEFNREDVDRLAGYMRIYHARPEQTIIREGDIGDYMLLVIRGEVDIYKRNLMGEQQLMTSVTPGMTLGEMSMIDGEPRFASCIAATPCQIAVLSRENLARIILEQPVLGSKVLMEMVLMLSQRLRQTSQKLVSYMDKDSGDPAG